MYVTIFFIFVTPFNSVQDEVIFIHYKSRIATAIRGLWWMKKTMVNSGLKGLTLKTDLIFLQLRGLG